MPLGAPRQFMPVQHCESALHGVPSPLHSVQPLSMQVSCWSAQHTWAVQGENLGRQLAQKPPPCPSGKQESVPQQSAFMVQFWPDVWQTSHCAIMHMSPLPAQQSDACMHEPPCDTQQTPPVQPPSQQSLLPVHLCPLSTHAAHWPAMHARPEQQSDDE